MKQSGFTLVEISIVIIIVGLIIGGVLKGYAMVMNARVVSVVSQTKEIFTAYQAFKDSYRAIPGDISNAAALIPGCTAENFCSSGNGNGFVGPQYNARPYLNINSEITSESTQFWKHLALTGVLSGVKETAGVPAWGDTHPKFAFLGGFHVRSGNGENIDAGGHTNPGMVGIILVTRNNIAGEWICGIADPDQTLCSVAPTYAYRIDSKTDDGRAMSGSVQGISAGWANGCGEPNEGINDRYGYAPGSSITSCDMMFKISY